MNTHLIPQLLILVDPYLGLVEEALDVSIGGIESDVAEMNGVWGTGGELNGSAGRVARLSLLSVSESYMIKGKFVQ